MRGVTGDVIIEALKRARERWEDEETFQGFSGCLIRSALPSQLRAAVSAAISGGCQFLLDSFFRRHGRLDKLSSADHLALLHELLDHGCGKSITGMDYPDPFKQIAVSDMLAVLQRLAAAPAMLKYWGQLPPQAAHFKKEEVLQLADAAIFHGHHCFADRLVELPAMQLVDKQELYTLLGKAAHHDSISVFWKLTHFPLYERVDDTLLLNLLQLLVSAQPKRLGSGGSQAMHCYLQRALHSLPPVRRGQLLKMAMQKGKAQIFSALTEVEPLMVLSNLQDFLREAIAGGHELAACNLLRSPEAGKLPRAKLQELQKMAVEQGQGVVQRGLDYLLHLQQLEASIMS
jgi:hypothetical protein